MKKLTAIVITLTMLISMLVIPMGVTAATPEENDALALKTNFPLSEDNGANAKFFMPYTTWQTYKTNQNVTEEWVKGLDYVGLANTETDSSWVVYSRPTGEATDTVGYGKNNALLYNIDGTKGTGEWTSFVSLTTKNNSLTWTVNNKEFVINPYENIVKVYSNVDATGVTNSDLRARFETLKNPVLDIEDGCYESITVLAGSTSATNLTPTVVYEGGQTEKLTAQSLAAPAWSTGEGQDTGFVYAQALTNWGNTNQNGKFEFQPITISGFDTSKKIDKISFESEKYGVVVYVLSAFGESASLIDILDSADTEDYDSVVNALNTVDAILAENNLELSDLKAVTIARYNELKAAKEALAVFTINGIELENNTVTVNYTNGTAASVDALLIVAQYNSNETELKSVKKYPVSLTTAGTTLTQTVETTAGNKVKVLIWKDLVNFFPLTANIYNN